MSKWMMVFVGVVGWVVSLGSTICHADPPRRGLDRETIQSFAQPLIDGQAVRSVVVGVVQGDQRLTVPLQSTSASDSSKPFGGGGGEKPLHEIGSITKVFTSLLLADAVERGVLKLDDPVSLDGWDFPKFGDVAITYEHLATHRSGLPRLPAAIDSSGKTPNPYANFYAEDAREFLASYQLTRQPGTAHEYSNLGAAVLGHIVADRQGMTYQELLHRRIAEPLGIAPEDLTTGGMDRIAPPHSDFDTETIVWEFADLPGAGGIHASMDAMTTFANACLHPPDNELGRAIERTWNQRVPRTAGAFAMGLGWMIAGDGSTRWHNGRTGGSTSTLFVNRDLDAAVIVLADTGSPHVMPVGELLVQRLAGMPVEPRTIDVVDEVTVPVDQMKRLEGRYVLAPNFEFDVKVQNDRLMVGVTQQPVLRVYPKSPTEWVYKAVNAKLVFELPEQGPARALVLHQNGVQQRAPRK